MRAVRVWGGVRRVRICRGEEVGKGEEECEDRGEEDGG